jgi:hypothetical protein
MTAQQQIKARQWTRQIDLLCPFHQEAIDAARSFGIPELDNDAIGLVTQQLFHNLFMHFRNHVLPEELAPLIENLVQCFVGAAVQSGIAYRVQLRTIAENTGFQSTDGDEAMGEAARLCVIAGSFAAAARGAISGMDIISGERPDACSSRTSLPCPCRTPCGACRRPGFPGHPLGSATCWS